MVLCQDVPSPFLDGTSTARFVSLGHCIFEDEGGFEGKALQAECLELVSTYFCGQ